MGSEKIICRDYLGFIRPRGLVFTCGCFDILHPGHVHCLEEAKKLGGKLFVALNSDVSMLRKHPPVMGENDRAYMLSRLECVDYVYIFEEESPIDLIQGLKPSIYVKGGDYTIDSGNQIERAAVESYGGCVEIIPTRVGWSTWKYIERIKAQEQKKV